MNERFSTLMISPSYAGTESEMDTTEIENELVGRAELGDAEAAIELLYVLRNRLDHANDSSNVSAYFARCITEIVENKVSAEIAFNLYNEESDQRHRRGGLAKIWDKRELAALHKWLTRFGGLGIEEANGWIEEHVGASRRTTQESRAKPLESAEHQYLNEVSERLLLDLTGSLRRNLGKFQRIR